MGILKDYGIVVSDGKVSKIFESLFENVSFLEVTYLNPSDFVRKYWEAYEQVPSGLKDNNTNGKIFEHILATLFVREGITPYFVGSKIAFVPNVNFDFTLFTTEQFPISISAKTSLRERYKQADLESIALKYVHRRAKAYLITNSLADSQSVNAKIKKGDVIGLDDVIFAQSSNFDDLMKEIKKYKYCDPGSVKIITSTQTVTGKPISQV